MLDINDTTRYKNFKFLLYLDNDEHNEIYEHLKQYQPNFASIIHNRDTDENGELKKIHRHCCIWLGEGVTFKHIVKSCHITATNYRFVDTDSSKQHMLAYLVHAEKYKTHKVKYDLSEVVGNITAVEIAVNSVNKLGRETDILRNIFAYIESGNVSLRTLKTFVLDNGYWDVYRRNYTIIKDVLK